MYFIVIVFSFSLKKSIVVVRDMYRLSVSCFGYDCTQSIKFKPIKIISPFVKLTCFVLSCRRLPFKIMNCCMSFENHTTLLFHDLHLGKVYYLKANLANTITQIHFANCVSLCLDLLETYNSFILNYLNQKSNQRSNFQKRQKIDLC